MAVVSGTAYWACVAHPNTTFDEDGVWTIDVGLLDAPNKKLVKNLGLSLKDKGDDRGEFVTVKRKVRRKGGGVNRPPSLVDSELKPMFNTLIGNGSKVNVRFETYDWEFGGKSGTGADLVGVQVVDLVSFGTNNVASEEGFEAVSGGYSSSDKEDIPFPSN
jgi:hypothetical protein